MTEPRAVDYNVVSYILGDDIMARMKMPPEEYRKKQNENHARFDKANTTMVTFKLNNNTDKDIISFLQTVSNKQGLIKQLIRSHMAEAGFVAPTPDTKEED